MGLGSILISDGERDSFQCIESLGATVGVRSLLFKLLPEVSSQSLGLRFRGAVPLSLGMLSNMKNPFAAASMVGA